MSARRSVLPNFPDLVDKLDNRWLQMADVSCGKAQKWRGRPCTKVGGRPSFGA